MPRDVARANLYRGSINLWVEDELSREYLSALWSDPDVAFLVGGGNDGVRAIVRDAEVAGFSNVFGVIDRDFQESNRHKWLDPGKNFRTFVLPVHEIENYLLDANALTQVRQNNRSLAADEIEALMRNTAGRLQHWAACRDVLAELKRRFRESFIENPPCSLGNQVEAINHIRESRWFIKLESEVRRSTEADVVRLLETGLRDAQSCLSNGRWRADFAGKEIFRDIGSRIFDGQKNRFYQDKSPALFQIDLAKDVAAAQVSRQSVLSDLTELLKALKQRIARPQTQT